MSGQNFFQNSKIVKLSEDNQYRADTALELSEIFLTRLSSLLKDFYFKVYVKTEIKDNMPSSESVFIDFSQSPLDAKAEEVWNSPVYARIQLKAPEGLAWSPGGALPPKIEAELIDSSESLKFRRREGTLDNIVAGIIDWFMVNLEKLTNTPEEYAVKIKTPKINKVLSSFMALDIGQDVIINNDTHKKFKVFDKKNNLIFLRNGKENLVLFRSAKHKNEILLKSKDSKIRVFNIEIIKSQ